mmetsp:Transcript_137349/g.333766  ORF Transcript_137349/g.333766 Transcript_137349/m.333766 type:complete len:220 (+) Transcript_137349:1081-1740(+)
MACRADSKWPLWSASSSSRPTLKPTSGGPPCATAPPTEAETSPSSGTSARAGAASPTPCWSSQLASIAADSPPVRTASVRTVWILRRTLVSSLASANAASSSPSLSKAFSNTALASALSCETFSGSSGATGGAVATSGCPLASCSAGAFGASTADDEVDETGGECGASSPKPWARRPSPAAASSSWNALSRSCPMPPPSAGAAPGAASGGATSSIEVRC